MRGANRFPFHWQETKVRNSASMTLLSEPFCLPSMGEHPRCPARMKLSSPRLRLNGYKHVSDAGWRALHGDRSPRPSAPDTPKVQRTSPTIAPLFSPPIPYLRGNAPQALPLIPFVS